MTLESNMLFDAMTIYRDPNKVTAAIADAKELFGENTPYTVEHRMDETVVVFNPHTISTIREALSTGCMAKMNAAEEELFIKFIDYQNGTTYRDITVDYNDVLGALDRWLMDELLCNPHPTLNACFDSPDHTWTTCGGAT